MAGCDHPFFSKIRVADIGPLLNAPRNFKRRIPRRNIVSGTFIVDQVVRLFAGERSRIGELGNLFTVDPARLLRRIDRRRFLRRIVAETAAALAGDLRFSAGPDGVLPQCGGKFQLPLFRGSGIAAPDAGGDDRNPIVKAERLRLSAVRNQEFCRVASMLEKILCIVSINEYNHKPGICQ